jgi:hypothetical protein
VGVAIAVVVAIGGAVGWVIGGGGKSAEAAPHVRYMAADALQNNAFTPGTDIPGRVVIKGAPPFGGTGSNFVCDRELLIKYLTAKPARLRAWARVQTIAPTVSAVARYIRSLKPATLLTPTRVTNYSYVKGRAVAFPAVLGPGTAVLVDKQGAVRARCRCGNPLQDPIISPAERCDGCPAGYRLPPSWRLSPIYYVVHPAPPPVKGQRALAGKTGRLTVRVVEVLLGGYVIEESLTGSNGKTDVRTVTVPKPASQTVTRSRTSTRKVAVTVSGASHTVFVPRTTTLTRTVTATRVVPGQTVTKRITVRTGGG